MPTEPLAEELASPGNGWTSFVTFHYSSHGGGESCKVVAMIIAGNCW